MPLPKDMITALILDNALNIPQVCEFCIAVGLFV